jgi:hypothetical protein
VITERSQIHFNRINNRSLSRVVLFLILIVSICLPMPAAAQQAVSDNLSVIFVFDDSGSMETNDPNDLRATAVKLFIALLDPGDGAAIVTFADESEIKSHFTIIQGYEDKVALINSLGEIRSEGYTNMKAAFKDVLEVRQEDRSSNQKIVIFLTDGDPQMRDGLPPRYKEDTLELVRQINLPVMAIGLTAGGLNPFLGRVTDAAAEGSQVIPAKTANDLLDVYLGILGQLKDRTIVGSGSVKAPGTADLSIYPALAQYVDSVSFIAVKSDNADAILVSPEGNTISPNDNIFSETFSSIDPSFILLTMPAPLGGGWQMEFQGSGVSQARAILRSRLRVSILRPGYFSPVGAPMPIVANLILEDPPQPPIVSIGDVTFSALIEGPNGLRESLDLLYDDGTHGDQKAGDGDFTNDFVNTDTPGTYVITITGRKGVVPVSTRTQVELIEFPKIVLEAPASGPAELEGPLEIRASLLGGEPPELDQGELFALITRPDGFMEKPVPLTQNGSTYSGQYIPIMDGKYRILVITSGATYKGIPYETEERSTVNVTLIPTIAVLPDGGEPSDPIDLGRLLSLKDTHQVAVQVTSTSQHEESIKVSLSGIPGGQVSPEKIHLEPNANKKVILEIKSESNLPARKYDQARLVFSTQSRAKLLNPEIPVKFEISSVLIRIEPEEINLINVLQLGPESSVTIKALSNSPFPHPLRIASVEPADFQVTTDPQNVQANGTTPLKLLLSSKTKLKPGDYTVRVRFSRPDPLVNISPETIIVRIHVPSWLERFGLLTGLLAGIALLSAGTLWAMIPSPRGQLAGLEAPAGKKPKSYYLSQYITIRKGYNKKVAIGKSDSNDIVLDHSSVSKQHAVIRAGKRSISQKVGRGIKQKTRIVKRTVAIISSVRGSQVRVNDILVPSTGTPLQRKDIVQIGEYKFEYR